MLRHKKALLWLVTVVSSLFCVVVCEVILRCFFAPPFYQRSDVRVPALRHDPMLGWFPKENSHTTAQTTTTYRVDTNSKGFRDREPTTDAKARIAFLGDSFVWGFDVEASNRFTELLQVRHPEWNIVNLGIVAYGTDQELLLIQKFFEDYKPSLVFLVFCSENDPKDNCWNVRNGCYKPYFTVQASGDLQLNGVPAPKSDQIIIANHPILCWPYLVQWGVHDWLKGRLPAPFHNPKEPTDEILTAMNKFVRGKGAAFAVGLTHHWAPMETFLQGANIPFVDLSTTNRFPDYGFHWTPQGHVEVCQKIEGFLGERWRPAERKFSGTD
ncbi:MAG TPA: SGNH/GDSL hydrolase family protein [Candidatus Dormibacteraeota bacterium]|nr:SGNH/GDSL hydrolase family protein [Candidatus Dormibacteraeota bacterium]